MAVPGFQTFFRPLLGLAVNGEIPARDCIQAIPKLLKLSSEDLKERTAGGSATRVVNRDYWAITHMFHAGLLERPRHGVIVATARGSQVYQDNPDYIDMAVLQQFPEYRAFRARKKAKPSDNGGDDDNQAADDAKTPIERIEDAAEELNEALREDLRLRILQATPTALERLSIRLMTAMGYGDSELSMHLGKTGDGGVDGVILQDRLGLDAIFLQAKRNKLGNSVGVDKIHQFAGALEGKKASKGVFVTTSTFSKAAKDFAENKGQKSLVLIDGEELARLLIEHGVGVRSDRKYELKRLDEDYFLDLDV